MFSNSQVIDSPSDFMTKLTILEYKYYNNQVYVLLFISTTLFSLCIDFNITRFMFERVCFTHLMMNMHTWYIILLLFHLYLDIWFNFCKYFFGSFLKTRRGAYAQTVMNILSMTYRFCTDDEFHSPDIWSFKMFSPVGSVELTSLFSIVFSVMALHVKPKTMLICM